MDGETEFFELIDAWAEKQGKRFVIDEFDEHEMDGTLNGIHAADVWGWLIDPDDRSDRETLKNGDNDDYGCLEWSVSDGEIRLEFNKYTI